MKLANLPVSEVQTHETVWPHSDQELPSRLQHAVPVSLPAVQHLGTNSPRCGKLRFCSLRSSPLCLCWDSSGQSSYQEAPPSQSCFVLNGEATTSCVQEVSYCSQKVVNIFCPSLWFISKGPGL